MSLTELKKLYPEGITFCGIHLSQTWADLFLWEQVLNNSKPARVLELGTYYGGFSAYLQVQARVRGFEFHTIDNGQNGGQLLTDFVTNFHSYEIFSAEGKNFIEAFLTQEGLSILFCDNGNKEREADELSPFLKQGDLIAVHDWGTECNHIPDYLTLYNPDGNDSIYTELDSVTRFFVK